MLGYDANTENAKWVVRNEGLSNLSELKGRSILPWKLGSIEIQIKHLIHNYKIQKNIINKKSYKMFYSNVKHFQT
jgi:hypothetical protein